MLKKLCYGKGSLAKFILRFIHPSKPIREKYPNRPKMHKLEFISHVYTFYLDNFGGVEF